MCQDVQVGRWEPGALYTRLLLSQHAGRVKQVRQFWCGEGPERTRLVAPNRLRTELGEWIEILAHRCRVNVAHVRQSRPHSGESSKHIFHF